MIERAILEGDLVVGRSVGLDDGPVVPVDLRDLPDDALRFDGKKLVDARGRRQWHVDEMGRKRLTRGAGRHTITCDWNARLVRSGDDGWRASTASDDLARRIKLECRRRIVAVVKDTPTQINLSGYVSELLAARVLDKGKLTNSETADIDTARQTRAWVSEMQAASRRLIADADEAYLDDASWPAAPEGAAELSARF